VRNGERLFYLVLLLISLGFVIKQSGYSWSHRKRALPTDSSQKSLRKLCTFVVTPDNSDSRELVHFREYREKYFAFYLVSPECPHCLKFLSHWQDIAPVLEGMGDRIEAKILCQSDQYASLHTHFPDIPFYSASRQDLTQFGYLEPMVLLTRGNGIVVYKAVGDQVSETDSLLKAYQDSYFRKASRFE